MKGVGTRALVLTGLAVTLLLAGVGSFYASSHPDGLQHVAQSVGISQTTRSHPSSDSPFAGYTTSGVSNQRLSGGLAGVVGVGVVGLLGGGLTWALRSRRPSRDEVPPETDPPVAR